VELLIEIKIMKQNQKENNSQIRSIIEKKRLQKERLKYKKEIDKIDSDKKAEEGVKNKILNPLMITDTCTEIWITKVGHGKGRLLSHGRSMATP